MGFVVENHLNESSVVGVKKKNQALVYGKAEYMWQVGEQGPGVGVTKPLSSIVLICRFFIIFKTLVTYWISLSYLSGVITAELWWHLSNLKAIQRT